MTMTYLPLAHGLRSHLEECQRVAWFVLESMEREQLITLRAMAMSAPAWPAAVAGLAMLCSPWMARPATGRGGAPARAPRLA